MGCALRSELVCGLGDWSWYVAWEIGAGWEWSGGAGAKEVRKGLQLGPLGIGSFEFLLFDLLA